MNNQNEMSQPGRLTWNRAAVYIIAVMLLCIAAGIFLASRRIYLRPPWSQYTIFFYVSLWLPVVLTIVLCMRKQPAGRWLMAVILLVFLGIGFCSYLALLGPAMVSDIMCDKPQLTGLMINQDCRCQWKGASESSTVECKLEGVSFLPFARLIEVR